MPEVFLSIGSNIDPDRHIPAALVDLEETFGPLSLSSLYETAAVGFEGPPFHNLVAAFHTPLPIDAIATRLRDIEERHGRKRNSQKFSSRTLDVDLILYGDLILETGSLKLPRPEILHYAFVLEPLAEIAPEKSYPGRSETFAELWRQFDKSGLEQRCLSP